MHFRSTCPVNLALEIFGDKWTLLIIRDLLFEGKRYYREFLHSEEKIATNILADRLERLEKEGLIVKQQDERHKQKIKYSLTERGIDLLPLMVEVGAWSAKYLPVDPMARERAIEVKKGGTRLHEKLKKQLREEHIGQKGLQRT